MKTNIYYLIAVFSFFSLSVFSQIKVNSTGRVGIGSDPDLSNLYNLCTYSAIFKTSGYSNTIIIGHESSSPRSAIYPYPNNSGTIGYLGNQFQSVYATSFYANGVLLSSDKRLKENFSNIDQPLNKLLQINGQKYDFISQGTDTIKDEKERQTRLMLEKNRLGFIAQDLQKVVPEAVLYFEDGDRYYIDYNAIIPVIVER